MIKSSVLADFLFVEQGPDGEQLVAQARQLFFFCGALIGHAGSVLCIARSKAAQHHRIDPILEAGDRAFVDLAHPEQAEAVLAELKALLDEHLAFEEEQVTPFVRDTKEFPAPADDSRGCRRAASAASR